MATNEVELEVKQVEEAPQGFDGGQLVEVVRKMVMAAVGAVALTTDEAQSFLNRLVERGEVAQKDAEKLMKEVGDRFGKRPALNAPVQTTDLTKQIENGLETILNRLNVPSKRDIDELSAKIAQLAVRVEDLRKSQEVVPAKAKAAPATTPQN